MTNNNEEHVRNNSHQFTYKELAYIICNQPTAYDKEKVIELADRRIEFLDATHKILFDAGDFKNADLNAIRMKEVIAIKEVIRKGGVDG